MAPIKFEETIKKQLKSREIQPSSEAWDTLSKRLDDNKKKPNKTLLWYSIAAGFIGLLFIGSLVFSEKNTNPNELLVIEDFEESNKASEEKIIETPKENTIIAVEENTKVSEKENLNTSIVSTEKNIIKNDSYKVNNEPSVYKNETENKVNEAVVSEEKNIEKETTTIISKEKSLFDKKVDEVVAQVQNLQKESKEITQEDIDELLKAAQRDLKAQKYLNPTTNKVDAAALLMDVEFELERTFRDKVFEALGDGYQIIRTAVTDRNN